MQNPHKIFLFFKSESSKINIKFGLAEKHENPIKLKRKSEIYKVVNWEKIFERNAIKRWI